MAKTILITGCSAGVGKGTAILLAEKGHTIIALNRKSEKAELAFKEICAVGSGNKYAYYADLSDPDSINAAADKICKAHEAIDVLINNAGVLKAKETFSADGSEMTFAVNLRAPAILSKRLIPTLRNSKSPRIVFVSSAVYYRAKINPEDIFSTDKFTTGNSYARSKMMINMLAEALSEHVEGMLFYSVHPGVIATDVVRDYPKLFSWLAGLFLSKPEKGAAPVIMAAIEDIDEKSGTYFMEKTAQPIRKIPGYEKIKETLYQWYTNL